MEVNVGYLFGFILQFIQKLCVLLVCPRIEECEVVFQRTFEIVLESPLNPAFIVFLSYLNITMADVLTLSLTRLHSSEPSYR